MHKNILHIILHTLLANFAVWGAKVACLWLASQNMWLVAGVPAFALLGTFLSLYFLKTALKTLDTFFGNPKKKLGMGSVLILIFTAIQALPLVPDTYFAFRSEGVAHPVAMSLFSISVGAVALALVRVPPLLFVQPVWASGFLVYVFEAALFVAVPLCYWASFPLPLPLYFDNSLQNQKTQGFLNSERQTAPKAESQPAHVFLIDPEISDLERHKILERGNAGIDEFNDRVVREIYSVVGKSNDGLQILVFPETTLYLNSEQFRYLSEGLETRLFKGAQENPPFIVMGARYGANNVVFFSGPHLVSGIVFRGIVAQKKGLVPFFEDSSFGLSVREQEAEFRIPQDEMLGSRETRGIQRFLPLQSLSICYEALNAANWKWGQSKLVLTNHFTFSHFWIASALYDYNLRLLSSVFRAPLILVGNKGGTGAFLPASKSSKSVEVARRFGGSLGPPEFDFIRLRGLNK